MFDIANKLLFGLSVLLFRLIFRQRPERWLIGENIGRLSFDNGYCFYQYCRARNQDCRLVLNEESVRKLDPDAAIIRYGSLKHAYYYATSGTLIYTHTLRDVIYSAYQGLLGSCKKTVFLQHGVTALKRFNADYQNRKNDMDLFVLVSEQERQIVLDNVAPDAQRLIVTGFPRYDRYSSGGVEPAQRSRRILYMPTWRDWIAAEDFPASELYREISAFVASPELSALLAEYGYSLDFILHLNMREHMSQFHSTAANITVLCPESTELHELIQSSDILLTDYSSICWDFLYQKKPTVFFQFDRETYSQHRGGYLDISRDDSLFGVRALSGEQVLAALRDVLASGCRFTDADEHFRQKWFDFFDDQNCKRVCERIEQLR